MMNVRSSQLSCPYPAVCSSIHQLEDPKGSGLPAALRSGWAADKSSAGEPRPSAQQVTLEYAASGKMLDSHHLLGKGSWPVGLGEHESVPQGCFV